MNQLQGNAVRTLDQNKDWTMGNNIAGYLQGNPAIAQQITCRLNQYLGECFWDISAGINWFGFLGGKNPVGLNLAIATCILNTTGVLAINNLDFVVDTKTREFRINWNVSTVFSTSFPGTSVLANQ